jgi:hypothetical protein
MTPSVRLHSIRPLVRYVDQDHAVVEAHFITLSTLDAPHAQPPRRAVRVHLEIDGSDGFHDEGDSHVPLTDHRGSVRFEIVCPQRWWPAGMGDQPLYRLSLQLEDPGYGTAEAAIDFGLTSVRRDRVLGRNLPPSLLVNGQICDYDTVVTVDRIDESQILPATGDTLLLIRDHFGNDLLYTAADHAGILLIQAVPLSPDGRPSQSVAEHIARLTPHPSLAGYYVGHLGQLSDRVADALRQQDPTRPVFRRFPLDLAA